ncbi:hypothetical protein GCM10022384_42270 [Streptomyces marokkonensis]|uniref:Uncharacterized protein n=1 Tax=Streptomyces marokkonensis TaxID=324855 RepID=A0ABP7QYN7_9ACTN
MVFDRLDEDHPGHPDFHIAYQMLFAPSVPRAGVLLAVERNRWNPHGRPLGARFAHWYNTRLFHVAVGDARVWTAFVRVVNMVSSPAALFRPAIALKVLAPRTSRRKRTPAPVPRSESTPGT